MRWFLLYVIVLSAHATSLVAADHTLYDPPRDRTHETAYVNQGGKPWSVEEAIERAIECNQGRNALAAESNWIDIKQKLASATRAPQIRLDFGENEGLTRMRYGLRIYPSTPWGKRKARKYTEYRTQFSEMGFRIEAHELAMTIRRYYAALYQQKRMSGHLEKVVELRSQQFQEIGDLVADGQGVVSDRMRARLNLLEATSKRNQIEQERRQLRNELATLLGLRELDENNLKLAASVHMLSTMVQPLDNLVRIAYARRSDLAALSWQRRMADLNLESAKKSRIPWPSHIQGSIEDEESSSGDTWTVQMAIDLPLGRGISTRIAMEQAERNYYTSQMEKLEHQIANEVRIALSAVETSKANLAQIKERDASVLRKMLDDLRDTQIGGTLQPNLRAELHHRILETRKNCITAAESYEAALLKMIDVVGNAVP